MRFFEETAKVIVSDYDGTLCINSHDMAKNKAAILKFREEGNAFIVATGRSYLDFRREADLYGFTYDYAIINHGAAIIDKRNRLLMTASIDAAAVDILKRHLQLNRVSKWFCCSGLDSRVDFDHRNLSKINLTYPSETTALAVNTMMNDQYRRFVQSYYIGGSTIEIVPSNAGKEKAIANLLKQTGIKKNNVYTIGDGYSDVEMIKNYHGYAMANAVTALKMYAQKECNSVSDLIGEVMQY